LLPFNTGKILVKSLANAAFSVLLMRYFDGLSPAVQNQMGVHAQQCAQHAVELAGMEQP
jgi:hypothetical protein